MTAKEIIKNNDFKKCLAFHGHICPGLSIGYKASIAGMNWLKENRSSDEEIVALVETDACCVDAIQVITGCTFGKGNFIFKDHGKNVFTFFSRQSGKGIRIAVKNGAIKPSKTHFDLINKIRSNEANKLERKEFRKLHTQRSYEILEMSQDDLFYFKEVKTEIPPKAVIEPSKICSNCGEPAMESKMSMVDDKLLCKDCI